MNEFVIQVTQFFAPFPLTQLRVVHFGFNGCIGFVNSVQISLLLLSYSFLYFMHSALVFSNKVELD